MELGGIGIGIGIDKMELTPCLVLFVVYGRTSLVHLPKV